MWSIVLEFFAALLGGGVGGSIVAWWLESRSEHKRWLRDQKLQASAQFLHAIYGMSGEMLKMKPGDILPLDFIDRVTATEQTLMQFISPRPVIEAAQAITRSVGEWSQTHTNETVENTESAFFEFRDRITQFTIAVRADLKTGSGDDPKPRCWFRRNKLGT
jgi:hypothetical protein